MVGGFIYFDTPIDTSVIEADIEALQSEMSTKVTQGGDDTGAFPLEVGTKTAQPFVITTNLLARIRVLANGRTLVQKTTDTGEALQVGGTVQADTVNSPNIGTTTAADAKFCANNVEGLRIFNATQNVAIGSTLDAGFKLNVNGTTGAAGSIRSYISNLNYAQMDNTGFFISRTADGAASHYVRRQQDGIIQVSGRNAAAVGTDARNQLYVAESGAVLHDLTTINGTYTPAASAILDIRSDSKGVLLSRMSTTRRLLITAPATGLMVYDTTINHLCFFDGAIWQKINHSPA